MQWCKQGTTICSLASNAPQVTAVLWTWRKASDNVFFSWFVRFGRPQHVCLGSSQGGWVAFLDYFDTSTGFFPLGSKKPRSCMSNHASQAWPATLDLLTDMLSRQVARVGVYSWDHSSLGLMNQTMVTILNNVYVDAIAWVFRPKVCVFHWCLMYGLLFLDLHLRVL